MKSIISQILGGRLQIVLILGFSLVAAFTVGLSAVAISRVISDYLTMAENERVARDMDLANAFYQLKLDEVAAISNRLVRDPWVQQSFQGARQNDAAAIQTIDQIITQKITVLALGGTHLIAILDKEGNILVGRVLSADGYLMPVLTLGNWGNLAIIETVLSTGKEQAATEIVPDELLTQVGLEEQAYIALIETPKAADNPFDTREGKAGLTLIGVSPLIDDDGHIVGAILAAHLFNNDFTLVDRIKQVAGVDTVTIFFGDLRVSTNVLNDDGTRAVGTRVSEEVFEVVLLQDRDYVGDAFVVNETYITRYEPLHDHQDQVVGSLYVGAREAVFQALVDTFQNRVILIALVSILVAAVIAIPIAHLITRPIEMMVDATQRLAEGDMTVRVQAQGNGELAVLGQSFNSMVETLNHTQQELLHKEKLASMGQLAAGVAHELNNPLGTILLFSDAMSNELPKDSPHSKDVEMIVSEALRCKRIVADLLNFSRQQVVLARDIDIQGLLDHVIDEVSYQDAFEGVTIVRNYQLDQRTIQADPVQLQQVFINLLNNAAEAIKGKGTITLTTRQMDNKRIEIEVSDTGVGIPEENINKIFTPFFTTKLVGKGTGLGLSIIYGIIKMHRGQITVQSEVGKGTTFTVTLPIRVLEGQMIANTAMKNVIA